MLSTLDTGLISINQSEEKDAINFRYSADLKEIKVKKKNAINFRHWADFNKSK